MAQSMATSPALDDDEDDWDAGSVTEARVMLGAVT